MLINKGNTLNPKTPEPRLIFCKLDNLYDFMSLIFVIPAGISLFAWTSWTFWGVAQMKVAPSDPTGTTKDWFGQNLILVIAPGNLHSCFKVLLLKNLYLLFLKRKENQSFIKVKQWLWFFKHLFNAIYPDLHTHF